MKLPKLLYLEWEDITSWSNWHTQEEAEGREPGMIIQTGFFICEDNRYLTIANKYELTKNGVELFGFVYKIPKGCIRKRRRIKLNF